MFSIMILFMTSAAIKINCLPIIINACTDTLTGLFGHIKCMMRDFASMREKSRPELITVCYFFKLNKATNIP